MQDNMLTDDEREQVIAECYRLSMTGSAAYRRFWFNTMRYQQSQRTPQQVLKLEREKGLAA